MVQLGSSNRSTWWSRFPGFRDEAHPPSFRWDVMRHRCCRRCGPTPQPGQVSPAWNTTHAIDNAGWHNSGMSSAANGWLETPVGSTLSDSARNITPTRRSGDSGRPDRHSIFSWPHVPIVLGDSGHPRSGIPVVPIGKLVTPDGVRLASVTSVSVTSVGHKLSDGAGRRVLMTAPTPSNLALRLPRFA